MVAGGDNPRTCVNLFASRAPVRHRGGSTTRAAERDLSRMRETIPAKDLVAF